MESGRGIYGGVPSTKSAMKINSLRFFLCGVGGVRTLVQTTSFQAFYMLSSWLVFDMRPDKNTQRVYLGF